MAVALQGAAMEEGRAAPRRTLSAWSIMLSVAVHALIGSGVLLLAVRGIEKAEERERRAEAAAEAARVVDVELAPVAVDPRAREGVKPQIAGGADLPRIDTGSLGRGGEAASEAARHLADRDDRLRVTVESSTLHSSDQVQRIESSKRRSSFEDRRATTRPMELSFVLSGSGAIVERRPDGAVNASRGVLASRSPSTDGSGVSEAGEGAGRPASALPSGVAAPGLGVREGSPTAPPERRVRIAFARPDVPARPISVPAAERNRVRDNVDSRQAVASAVEAIVSASYAGGAAGEGSGGTSGGGAAGAGGASGAGSHPKPLGAGAGDWVEFDTTDPALASYFRRLKARLGPALSRAFPEREAIALRQGFVIVDFTIAQTGAIVPRLVRPSGIDEYDENCLVALRTLAPEPIPAAVGRTSLRVRGRFETSNPIVR